MANALVPVSIVQLTGSFATIYTVPGATTATVTMLHLVNTTGSPVTVDVCVVPNAGSAQQSTAILWSYSIGANDVLEILKGDIWSTGTTLQARAAATTSINLKFGAIQTT